MKKCNFIKCKYILHELIRGQYISAKDAFLNDNDISESVAAKIFTALRKANVIKKITRESSAIKDSLYNKEFFDNEEHNANILSAIVSRVDESKSADTVEYVFKRVPQNIYKILGKGYSNTLNHEMIRLFDEEHYQYFARLCALDPRVVCEINAESFYGETEKMVPLEILFHKNSLHIIFFVVRTKKIKILPTKSIYSSLLLEDENFYNFIAKEMIDEAKNIFMSDALKDNVSITLWLSPELLNHLIESDLIDSYKILGKREFVVLNQVSIPKHIKEMKKRMKEEKKRGRVYFNEQAGISGIDKYKVKIFSDRYRLLVLVKQYIEKEDLIKYRAIKKDLNIFCPKLGIMDVVGNILIFIAVLALLWIALKK